MRLYKDIAKEINNKVAPVLVFPIKSKLSVPIDLDALSHDMEIALNMFISKCNVLQKISIWGINVSLPNFDYIKHQQKKSNYIHQAAVTFFQKCIIE